MFRVTPPHSCGFCGEIGHMINQCNHPRKIATIHKIKINCQYIIEHAFHDEVVSMQDVLNDLRHYLSGNMALVVDFVYNDGSRQQTTMERVSLIKLRVFACHLGIRSSHSKTTLVENVIDRFLTNATARNYDFTYTFHFIEPPVSYNRRLRLYNNNNNDNDLARNIAQLFQPDPEPVLPPPPQQQQNQFIDIVESEEKIKLQEDITQCPICFIYHVDNTDIIMTDCNHPLCKECFDQIVCRCVADNTQVKCPMCRHIVASYKTATI